MTSSSFTTNILAPASTFTLHSSPKHHTFPHREEVHMTDFCGDCGTTVSKVVGGIDLLKDRVVVMGGTLDEGQGLENTSVETELYVSTRAGWLKEIEGSRQVQTVPGE